MTKNFIFQKYDFNPTSGVLTLSYSCDGFVFHEKIIFPNAPFVVNKERQAALDKCLFLLHIAAGISYYKAFGNPEIEIQSGTLTQSQALFFNDFYKYGLAQFAATNHLKLSCCFPFEDKPEKLFDVHLKNETFVPVGGGKDSCLSIELLKEQGHCPTLFSVNSARAIDDCKRVSGLPQITVQRQLSPVLLENNASFLNGHVPITGIIAFILLVSALLYDKRYVVMSCESSANESNFDDVNHQWSKSSAFEESFASLTQKVLPDFHYFSLLRPLTELHIAKLFSQKCTAYFDVFTSCNHAFHLDLSKRLERWCGHCDKCRFVFLALAPFMDKKKLIEIVGGNPLADETQLQGYKELLGLGANKPFECVGTYLECRAAFVLLLQKDEWKKDFIVNKLSKEVNLLIKENEIQEVFEIKPSLMIPKEFLSCLKIKK